MFQVVYIHAENTVSFKQFKSLTEGFSTLTLAQREKFQMSEWDFLVELT